MDRSCAVIAIVKNKVGKTLHAGFHNSIHWMVPDRYPGPRHVQQIRRWRSYARLNLIPIVDHS